jgi:phosphoribosylglycinamide formyltransferase-1
VTPARIAVLASGRGSNLAALLDASARGTLGGTVVFVASDVEGAPALECACRAGVEALHIAAGPGRTRLDDAFAAAYVRALTERRVDLVVLAGFMRVVGAALLATFPDRIVNIHPSLLPSFPGLHAQRQALAYGVKVAGCTAHLADATVDGGPVLVQEAVAVLDDDTDETLSARILEAEHRVLVQAVYLLATGAVRRDGRRIVRLAEGRPT